MLCSTRTRYFLGVFSLAAIGGYLVTFLPGSQDTATTKVETSAKIAQESGLTESSGVLLAATPQAASPEAAAGQENAAASPNPQASASAGSSEPSGSPHVVKPGESLASIAFHYLPQTKFMTTTELESAIREANPSLASGRIRPGLSLAIPGIEPQPIVERPRSIPRETEIRAIYLTGWTAGSERGIGLIRKWKEAGGNAICFDIKDFDGQTTIAFDHPLAPHRAPLIRNLPKFIRFMHQQDLHVIARIALFRDEHMAKNHSELAVQSRRSNGPWRENGKQVWTDPSRREVQDYNIALARRAAAAGADEIQFDYVRFPAEGDQADAKFDFESRNTEGATPDAAPAASPPAPPRWTRSRVITEFLEHAHAEVHPTGALLSLDVFGVMAWQRQVDLAHTGQKIDDMARHCDVLSPMIYPSHFFGMDGYAKPGDAPEHFISASMKRFREITAGSGVVLRPWLQAFGWHTPSYSPEYVVTQVSVASQNGAVGYLFWNANNDYSKPFAAMPTLATLARRRESERAEAKERAASKLPAAAPSASVPALDTQSNF
jgi:hypothetical protein